MSLTLLTPFQEAQFQFQATKSRSRSRSRRRESPMIQLPKSLFPSVQNLLPVRFTITTTSSSSSSRKAVPFPPPIIIIDSLLENPVIWISRVCVYYALLKAGLVGSQSSSDSQAGRIPDLGFSKWLQSFQVTSEEKEATNKRKLVRNWHPTTKGTLKRSYRVPSKPEGRRLLKAIASLLSDDDEFLDVTSHKGCQIRRESAHGESVCCNNVRALFDELPTPHLVLEITPFPAGPLSEKDYAKAGKLEKVLRSGTSI